MNQVVTAKTLESIVYPLLWNPVVDGEKPNRNRAEIAGLFIKVGLGYLLQKSGHFLSERLINDALELTELLVGNFPKAENS